MSFQGRTRKTAHATQTGNSESDVTSPLPSRVFEDILCFIVLIEHRSFCVQTGNGQTNMVTTEKRNTLRQNITGSGRWIIPLASHKLSPVHPKACCVKQNNQFLEIEMLLLLIQGEPRVRSASSDAELQRFGFVRRRRSHGCRRLHSCSAEDATLQWEVSSRQSAYTCHLVHYNHSVHCVSLNFK